MEFVAILAAVVVAVLQIITISVVVSMKKKVNELTAQKSTPSNNNDHDKRDRNFRPQQNKRRPVSDIRSKSQTPPTATPSASVDQVEKSLRDINLKLKNAERDQENARKKIQSSFPKDQSKRRDTRDSSPRDRNNRNNGPRDGNGLRDNRESGQRGGRDITSREPRRGGNNWQDRNNRRDNNNSSEAVIAPESSVLLEKTLPINELPNNQQMNSSVVAPVNSDLVQPSDFSSDDTFQHGRKVTVKRRMLKEEDSIIENTSSETNDPSNVSNINDLKMDSNDSSDESEIKFGRK